MPIFLSLTEVSFYLYFVYFLLASVATFLLPGLVLLSSKKTAGLPLLAQLGLAYSLGIVVFALLAYAVSLWQLEWLLLVYVGGGLYLAWRQQLWQRLRRASRPALFNRWSYLLISVGLIMQLSAAFGSGLRYANGLRFYWINGADGIFHLSLIEALKEQVPPLQPGAWPLPVTNYHFLSNLLVAKFGQLWQIPSSQLFFQYLPLLVGVLMAVVLSSLLYAWQAKRSVVNWGLFFLFFSADSAWLLSYLVIGQLSWISSTIDNGMIQFVNMPQALAKLALLAGLFLFYLYRQQRHWHPALLAAVVWGSLVALKVYFGIFIALATGIYCLYQWWRQGWRQFWRQERVLLLFMLLLASLSAVLFFPTNSQSGGLFWSPLDWPRLFVSQIGWQDWLLRMQVYQAHDNQRNIWILQLAAAAIFMLSIFGSRLIGLLIVLPRFAKHIPAQLHWLLYPASLILIFLGLNTVQVSGGHNVFNFFIVALTALTITSALVLGNLRLHWCWVLLIIAVTIPRNAHTFYHFMKNYYLGHDYVLLSNQRLDAYQFINTHYQDQLLQAYSNHLLTKETPQLHLFTKQRVYLDGIGILESHNQPIAARKALATELFQAPLATVSAQALYDSQIDLILLDKKNNDRVPALTPWWNEITQTFELHPELRKSAVVFENEEFLLYQIDQQGISNYLLEVAAQTR